jgi:tetratricopeptide (TPR) repeat protein
MSEVAQIAMQRGIALLDLGRAKEAEEQLRRALPENPNDARVLALLSDALLRQGEYDQALEVGRSAVAADPEYAPAYSVLCASLAGLERYKQAQKAVELGLALAPESAGLHLQKAGVLLAREHYEAALASIERAGQLDPENTSVATLRASALFRLRRYDEAAEAADEAVRLDPENAEAYRIRGVNALHRGGGKAAVQDLRTALRLDPTDMHSRQALSTAIKTRNPLYGGLLRFGVWLETVPRAARVALLLTPVILTQILRPSDDRLWAEIPIIVITAMVLLTWALEPLMNCVLLLGRNRVLLTREAKRATYGFLGFVVAAVACAVFGQVTGPGSLLLIALAFGLWAMATGMTHVLKPGARALVGYGAAAAAVIGAMAIAAVLVDAPAAPVAVGLVLIGGIAAIWIGAFSN